MTRSAKTSTASKAKGPSKAVSSAAAKPATVAPPKPAEVNAPSATATSDKTEAAAPLPQPTVTPKAEKTAKVVQQKARRGAQRSSASQASLTPLAGVVAPPVAEKKPAWPASDRPAPAQVTWDSSGLKIAATNASLQQILNQVSTATGTKVEGMGTDERIFGEFGPGQARDVLAQLLHGSGYNFLLIGDQGLGTPRQIVLSARRNGPAPPAAGQANRPPNDDSSDDDSSDAEPEPEEPRPLPRPGFSHPGAPRTPQEMQQQMLQMREEQQQQQQQQQQQPQDNPQNSPPPPD